MKILHISLIFSIVFVHYAYCGNGDGVGGGIATSRAAKGFVGLLAASAPLIGGAAARPEPNQSAPAPGMQILNLQNVRTHTMDEIRGMVKQDEQRRANVIAPAVKAFARKIQANTNQTGQHDELRRRLLEADAYGRYGAQKDGDEWRMWDWEERERGDLRKWEERENNLQHPANPDNEDNNGYSTYKELKDRDDALKAAQRNASLPASTSSRKSRLRGGRGGRKVGAQG